MQYDREIREIAHYVYHYSVVDDQVLQLAHTALLDALGCAIQTLTESESARRLVRCFCADAQLSNGARIPGTSIQLDPVKGAMSLGVLIRYLDHNDGMIGKEWGHPSDNIGALLPVMDWLCRRSPLEQKRSSGPPLTMRTLLEAIVKTYEIQGCMQQENAFNQCGLDHTVLVKIASAAVVPWLIGLSEEQAMACISHVWMDSASLRVYRHGENTIPRKGWAAGDACSRAVQFALMVQAGQPGAPTVLSMPRWGFYGTTWRGQPPFSLPMPYADWVIRNIVYKLMPVEGHGLTAVEAILEQKKRMEEEGYSNPAKDIEAIVIRTNAAAKLIIDKSGVLHNAADRDHCMQYCVAVSLLKGSPPETADYHDESPYATSKEVHAISKRIDIYVDDRLTDDYLNRDKRSIASGITILLGNGRVLDEILVEYPIGHAAKTETLARVQEKFRRNMALLFSPAESERVQMAAAPQSQLLVSEFMDLLEKRQGRISNMLSGTRL
ncbi:2-methylcitrate dehydratase [Lachnellula arida]|uniref:2-methylcitrate dehydratase n=1 Tax=Lachnellula arida TaxID=1316785 RepID=A0A8T9BKG6_9HELO|nr:2-methylcitrate dehydratase [Lachnellula arida]